MKNPLITLVARAALMTACGAGAGDSDDTTAINAAETSTTATESVDSPLTYPLVDTGQVAFYNTEPEIAETADSEPFFGREAAYTGDQTRQTDNGDATVTDNVTGLVWTQTPTPTGTVRRTQRTS